SSVLATCLTAALLFAGCGSEPSSQPSAPPKSSPEPSPTPTEEPPELVGGGTELFPDKRFIALYGHPSYPALGALRNNHRRSQLIVRLNWLRCMRHTVMKRYTRPLKSL